MKVLLSKVLALGGLCALFAGAGNVVLAQGDHDRAPGAWGTIQQERHELQVLHAVYDHEAASGHYQAAMRAHLRANAIRAHMRAQMMEMHRDRPDMHGGWNRP